MLFKGHTNVSEDLRSLPKILEKHLKTFQLSAHFTLKHYKTCQETWHHRYLHDFPQLKETLTNFRLNMLFRYFFCCKIAGNGLETSPQREISIYFEKFSWLEAAFWIFLEQLLLSEATFLDFCSNFWATFEKLRATFWEISSNLWKALTRGACNPQVDDLPNSTVHLTIYLLVVD